MEGISEAQLISDYLSGNSRAFESLYKQYERPLYSFILRFMTDRHNAEDIFQQTWMKVIKALPQYEERGKFSSWLFGIANNCCIDHARKKKGAKRNDSVDDEQLTQFPTDESDPEEELLSYERKDELREIIETLPSEQKQVVLLRIYSDLPFKEIAEIIGCPLNTVLGRMHYAVQNLRKQLNCEGNE